MGKTPDRMWWERWWVIAGGIVVILFVILFVIGSIFEESDENSLQTAASLTTTSKAVPATTEATTTTKATTTTTKAAITTIQTIDEPQERFLPGRSHTYITQCGINGYPSLTAPRGNAVLYLSGVITNLSSKKRDNSYLSVIVTDRETGEFVKQVSLGNSFSIRPGETREVRGLVNSPSLKGRLFDCSLSPTTGGGG